MTATDPAPSSTIRTVGAVVTRAGGPWRTADIEIGEPATGEVLIQVEAAGLCPSDRHVVSGEIAGARFPILGGHEGAGIVLAVGPGVTDFAVGDHVVTSFVPSCGRCRSCQSGNRNLCDMEVDLLSGEAISDGTHRVHTDGGPVHPMSLSGTFAPYAVVHQTSLVKIDPSIPFEIACLVGCGATTGYGAAVHTADISPGDDVAVIGLGDTGFAALQGALLSGATRVFVVDPVEWKRERALDLGASQAFASTTDAVHAVDKTTGGRMCSTVLATVASPGSSDAASWLELTAKNGTCVITGLNSVSTTSVIDLSALAMTQKCLRGSVFGDGNPHLDIPELLALYKLGDLPLGGSETREYRLDEIDTAFTALRDGQGMRAIVRFTEADRKAAR